MVVVDLDAFDANAADLRRRANGTTIRVASKSLRGPALQQVGPKRSPLYDTDDVTAFAREVVRRGHRLAGVMTYEGQVAGVPDAVPDKRAKSLVVRRLKSASVTQLETRRAEIARAL